MSSTDPTRPAVTAPSRSERARPVVAGIVTALVGFTSSFVVVLAGLAAVGATEAQAASGLLALSVTMGAACIVLSWRYRTPLTAAWSTPGAALLVATGTVDGGWPAAVGAFFVVAGLILLTALWPLLGAIVMRIPPAIAQGMLAGVLLPLCLAPITGLVVNPWGVLAVLATWLIALRIAPRWAVPLAFVAAAVVVGVHVGLSGTAVPVGDLLPRLEWTAPVFTPEAVVGLALPLYLVTMASQNVPGVAVLRSFGYDVPWRASMTVTGVGTAVGAAAGGHAINLAAISAALAAGPEAGDDRARRWIAGVTTGVGYIVLGLASAALAVLVALAPAAVIPAVAGIALFATLGSAVRQAMEADADRIPAVVTFLVAASGVALLGVSAAFWALVAGLVVRAVLRVGRRGVG